MQIIINHKNSPNVIIIIIERQILEVNAIFFPIFSIFSRVNISANSDLYFSNAKLFAHI